MALVSIRELLRDPKRVFETLETEGAPALVTRRGQVVAALVPVDPSEVNAYVAAALPELIQSRRDAENARAEGRTRPLDDVLAELEQEAAPGEGYVDVSADVAVKMEEAIGGKLEPATTTEAVRRVEDLTRSVLLSVEESSVESTEPRVPAATSPVEARVVKLVSHLFARAVQDALAERAGREVTTEEIALAIESATERVQRMNEQLAQLSEGGKVQLMTYEATVVGIEAFGATREHVAGSQDVLWER